MCDLPGISFPAVFSFLRAVPIAVRTARNRREKAIGGGGKVSWKQNAVKRGSIGVKERNARGQRGVISARIARAVTGSQCCPAESLPRGHARRPFQNRTSSGAAVDRQYSVG